MVSFLNISRYPGYICSICPNDNGVHEWIKGMKDKVKAEIDAELQRDEFTSLNLKPSDWSLFMESLTALKVGVDPNSAGIIAAKRRVDLKKRKNTE